VRSLYVPNLNVGRFELPDDEARHAIKALRAHVGDKFLLIDGKGNYADGKILEVLKRTCIIEVAKLNSKPAPTPSLTIIVCPTKQTDRFEWFLEKAVEIGVDRVIPVWCKRSERRVEKFDRWSKVLVSAMKQSRRTWLPVLEPACSLDVALELVEESEKLCVAHCMPSFEGDKKHLLHALAKDQSACIAIGPEGDFTEEEVRIMMEKGGVEISLGDSRLRTETAALSAVTYFRALQTI
jgi:16S rRNA (uracil1498-N3)-methyltransferase